MSKIVFILGAGASAQGGCPMMATFFNRMRVLHDQGRINHAADDYALIQKVRRTLMSGQVKASFDVENMERVFNALEMAEVLQRLGTMTPTEIAASRDAFVRLVVGVLERSQVFQSRSDLDTDVEGTITTGVRAASGQKVISKHVGPSGYDQLAKLIKVWSGDGHGVSVISFNYDIGLDFALKARGLGPVYRLSEEEGDGIELYKLHGSVNWFADDGDVVVADTAMLDAVNNPGFREVVPGPSFPAPEMREPVHFIASEYIRRHKTGKTPFIVPPSENKQRERARIANLWRRAAADLALAEVLIVIGYSLPDTDEFFRQFFAVGISGDVELLRVVLINPDAGASARLQRLIGLPVQQRVHVLPSNLISGVGYLHKWYVDNHKVFTA